MSYYRSPYGETFDVVDKSSTYEDGNISCMCEVRHFIWKFSIDKHENLADWRCVVSLFVMSNQNIMALGSKFSAS